MASGVLEQHRLLGIGEGAPNLMGLCTKVYVAMTVRSTKDADPHGLAGDPPRLENSETTHLGKQETKVLPRRFQSDNSSRHVSEDCLSGPVLDNGRGYLASAWWRPTSCMPIRWHEMGEGERSMDLLVP
jgi:hypothetical protein